MACQADNTLVKLVLFVVYWHGKLVLFCGAECNVVDSQHHIGLMAMSVGPACIVAADGALVDSELDSQGHNSTTLHKGTRESSA